MARCVGNNYPDIGTPRMWLINMLKELRNDGHKLILWTCRSNSSIPDMGFNNDHDLDDAVEWCRQFGLEFDAINENLNESKYPGIKLSRKIYADIYIDDKACLFLDGEENLAIIGADVNSGAGKIIKLYRLGE